MKLLHLSDLHIGKRVNEFSMIEDQTAILSQILQIAVQHKVDGVLIAGDVYDKSLPTIEGVNLFDDFLSRLHLNQIPVFVISGNHDSPERLNFGSRILKNNQVYIAGTFTKETPKITLQDEYGPVNIYLLPFVKPAIVNAYYPGVESYDDAVKTVLRANEVNTQERNVLVAHQFVTSGGNLPQQCDSEAISLGGLDNVDASAFEDFDYVALGHLHGPQRIGRDMIRYAGSPLKYSFSESNQKKSVTLVTLKEKGNISYELIPLKPLRDMRELTGPIMSLLDPANYTQGNTSDYIHATLTDEEEIYDAIGQIRSVYPNVMRIDFKNRKSDESEEAFQSADVVKKSPMQLFEEFYEKQNNVSMSSEQQDFMRHLFED